MEVKHLCTHVPVNDTVALESPMDEVSPKNVDVDTEVLYVPDSVDNMETQVVDDDCEQEIVLDSDDEGAHGDNMKHVADRVFSNEAEGVGSSNVEGLKVLVHGKTQVAPPDRRCSIGYVRRRARKLLPHSSSAADPLLVAMTCEERDIGPTSACADTNYKMSSGGIIDSETCKVESQLLIEVKADVEGNHVSHQCHEKVSVPSGVITSGSTIMKVSTGDALNEKGLRNKCQVQSEGRCMTSVSCDQIIEGLGYLDSQEPEDSSETDALNFVDRYLSIDNLDLQEQVTIGKSKRITSPPTSVAKGRQRLARRVNLSNAMMEPEKFDWGRSQRYNDEFPFQGESKNLNVGCKGGSLILHDMGDNFESHQTSFNAGAKKFSVYKPSMKNLDSESIICDGIGRGVPNTETNNGTNTLEELNGQFVRQQSEIGGGGTNIPEYDVGLDTQIAAEAIEALLYVPPLSSNAHQKSETMFQRVYEDAPFDMSLKLSKKRVTDSQPKLSTEMIDSQGKQTRNQMGFDYKLPGKMNARKGEPFSKESIDSGLPASNKTKVRKRSFRAVSKGKEGGSCKREGPNSLDKNLSLGEVVKLNSDHGKGLSREKPRDGFTEVQRTSRRSSSSSFRRSRDPGNTSKGKRVDAMDFDDSRKRRKINYLNDEESKSLGVSGRCFKLGSDTLAEVAFGQSTECNHSTLDVASSNSLLKLDFWNYPKGKRKHRSRLQNFSKSDNCGASDTVTEEYDVNKHPTRNGKDAESVVTCGDISPVDMEVPKLSNQVGKLKYTGYTSFKKNSEGMRIYAVPNGNSKGLLPKVGRKCVQPATRTMSGLPLMKELHQLVYVDSLTDFVPKDLRRRRSTANIRVLLSQNLDADVMKQQKKIVARLGFSFASCCSDATHFVSDKFLRTKNMLEAIALGKPVVTHLWLESCGQASCYINEKSYILRDGKKEKEIGFSMPVSLARANQNPLLEGQRVFITPNVKPGKDLIESLVKAAHGQVQEAEMTDESVLDNLLILSSQQDHAICAPFLGKGVAAYDSELLLNGIVIQKLEFQRHQLFVDHVKKKNLSDARRQPRSRSSGCK